MRILTKNRLFFVRMLALVALLLTAHGHLAYAGWDKLQRIRGRASGPKKKNKITIVTADSPIEGQSDGSGHVYMLTLQDAINLAIRNNRPLQFSEKQVDIARMKVLEAWRNFFPSVSLTLNKSFGLSNTGRYEGESRQMTLSQTLFSGGRILNSYKQARINVELALNNLEQLKSSLTTSVKESFYNVALYEMNVDIQEDVLKEAKRIYDIEKKLLSLEINTQLDYLNAISGYNTIKFTAISAKKDLHLALIALKNVLDIYLDSQVKTVYDLRLKKIDVDKDECMALAMKHRPDLKAQELNVEIAELAKKITLAGEKPTVSFDWENIVKGEADKRSDHIKPIQGYTWALRADIPLWFGNTLRYSKQKERVPQVSTDFFAGPKSYQDAYTLDILDNLGYYSEKESALLEREQKEYDYEELKRNVYLEVTQEYYNYIGILQQIENSLLKLEIAARELAINEVKRDLGEILVKELLDAQIALAQEKFSYIQLLTRYYMQLDKLSNTVGIPEYFTY